MKVLVVGGGGREHALCWKLRQSPDLDELYCAPGNPGIAEIADVVPVAPEEIHQLAELASDLKIDLAVVGPELPLALGIADEFAARGLSIFGPHRLAAQLESSRVFAKQFMRRHQLPVPPFAVIHDAAEGRKSAKGMDFPLVLKADGLAGGRGVLIATNREELESTLAVFFEERRFGSSADRVILEPLLDGEEVSFVGLSDGSRLLPMATFKDYNGIHDGDEGPRAGGMGAHSPAGVVSAEEASRVLEHILRPIVTGMAEENRPFVGALNVRLKLTPDGPRLLEINVRFGDPGLQAVLPRLEDDLLPVLVAAAGGDFADIQRLHFRQEAAACVVLASAGYPDRPVVGELISGLDTVRTDPAIQVFHARTARQNSDVVTAGGRVLGVCASGAELRDALRRAYGAAGEIYWPAKVFRRDIGRRVLGQG